ncbi:hypothetical protein JCM19046_1673 [Bacillus sp. JCM 19046]|nr:hypothetical protein JCM19045_256 [Bacillus sp. JCM 19045]GAF17177.1 hypothetical protein JCM19046_1673 [Bacillus sp. JCM 19046]
MKKGVLIPILIICFIVGGFFVIRAMNQADDVALSDGFTKRFLDTTVETDEGFYYFESGNGKFSMWFPEKYQLNDEQGLYISKSDYEALFAFQDPGEDNPYVKSMHVTYYERNENYAEITWEKMLDEFSYESHYEKDEQDNKTIYRSVSSTSLDGSTLIISDPENNPVNFYFALIINNDADEFVTIRYSLTCPEGAECDPHSQEEAIFFNTLLENVHFTN